MMKFNRTIALCAVTLGLVAARAEDAQPATAGSAPATSAPTKVTFTNNQIAEEIGWFHGKNLGLFELGFSKEELESLIKGLQAAAAGKDSPYEMNAIGPQVQQFMQEKQTAYFSKMKEKSTKENAELFEKLKGNKSVVALPSGVNYEIVKPGTGEYPKPTDTVKIHYTGTLANGTVFDSSVERGQPLELGVNQFVPGFTEGIQKINKGGKIKLYIPPQLGYGDEPKGEIPPGSALVFDVEMIDITPAASAKAEPAPAPATK